MVKLRSMITAVSKMDIGTARGLIKKNPVINNCFFRPEMKNLNSR